MRRNPTPIQSIPVGVYSESEGAPKPGSLDAQPLSRRTGSTNGGQRAPMPAEDGRRGDSMTCDQSKRSIASVVMMIGLGGFACAHSSSAPAPATAASAEPSGSPSETTTPASSAGAVTSASAAPTEAPPKMEKAEEEDEAAADLMEHHSHHHRGGVTRFIAMSLDTLGIAPDQRAAVEKIHAELKTSLTPARDADAKLLKVLADGVSAGSIDKVKVAVAVSRVETTSGAAHGASLDALNK